jgi:hypothetical protein
VTEHPSSLAWHLSHQRLGLIDISHLERQRISNEMKDAKLEERKPVHSFRRFPVLLQPGKEITEQRTKIAAERIRLGVQSDKLLIEVFAAEPGGQHGMGKVEVGVILYEQAVI